MRVYTRSPQSAFISSEEISPTLSQDSPEICYLANVEKSTIIIVDGVGFHIWELLQDPIEEKQLLKNVAEFFSEDIDTIQEGTLNFLHTLQRNGLLDVA